jgi:ankyrin repeat protein
LAAKHGDVEIARMLVERGANVAATTERGETVLLFAVANGQEQAAEFLMGLPGVDVNAQTDEHLNCLMAAIMSGYDRIAQLFIADPRTDVNAKVRGRHFGGASLAVGESRKEVFAKLLGREDLVVSRPKRALLHYILKEGYEDFIEMLLARGDVDINQRNTAGDSPLHLACALGAAAIVDVLLSKSGIDVNAVNEQEQTPLHLAEPFPEIVLRLIDRPDLDINHVDNSGQSPIHRFVGSGAVEVVRAICRRPDLDVNRKTKFEKRKMTPLMIAAWLGNKDIVQILLGTAGVNRAAKCKGRKTARAIAKERGSRDVADLLKHPDVVCTDVLASQENRQRKWSGFMKFFHKRKPTRTQ